MSTNKDIKIYGFGVVAQGFHNYLVSNKEEERLNTVIIKNANKSRKKLMQSLKQLIIRLFEIEIWT